MRNKGLVLLSILLVLSMLVGCSTKETKPEQSLLESTEEPIVEEVSEMKVPEDAPEITVKAGETPVPTIGAPIKWNGAMFKREPLYDGIVGLPAEAVILESGGNIMLDFGEYPPDEIVVTEKSYHYGISTGYWLSSSDAANNIVPTRISESVYEIKPIFISTLSDGEISIGRQEVNFYSVRASWGENIYEYGFFVVPVAPRKVPKEIPEIDITYITPTVQSYMQGDTEVVTQSETSGVGQYEGKTPYSAAPTKWNGAMFKRLPITEIVKADALAPAVVTLPDSGQNETTPYRIQIDFGEYPPESISAVQYITVAGVNDAPQSKMTELKLEKPSNSVYEIKITDIDFGNYTDLPNESYQPEVVISLNVAWGDNVCEYGFAVTPA